MRPDSIDALQSLLAEKEMHLPRTMCERRKQKIVQAYFKGRKMFALQEINLLRGTVRQARSNRFIYLFKDEHL